MKHSVWGVITAGFLLAGCAQSAPDLIDGANVSNEDAITGDTISIDETLYGNESTSPLGATGASYNSSSDGFQSIYFGFDRYNISGDMQASMAHNKQTAQGASGMIKIEGNCDEFGTDEYNYALGLKRAKAVKDSLIAQGVPSNKMTMVSFGESTPVCQSAEDSCYQQNRRVDLRIVR
jgi:peptidoglycan-associated lipoprotein